MDKSRFDQLAQSVGLAHLADQIYPLLQPCIRFHSQPADDKTLPVGASKIGGLPDLPPDVDIPQWHGKPLIFIAQFNLADVTAYDLEKALPLDGFLTFFYAADNGHWDTSAVDRGGEQVLYFPTGTRLVRKALQTPFAPCSLTFETEFTLPPMESPYIQSFWDDRQTEKLKLSREDGDRYWNLVKAVEVNTARVHHQLLGHPDQMQGDLFYNLFGEWRLLLQIDTDDDAHMMWGDVGKIYFLIQPIALKQTDFSNIWFTLQCT